MRVDAEWPTGRDLSRLPGLPNGRLRRILVIGASPHVGPSLERPVLNRLSAGFGDRARDRSARVGGSIDQRLSGFDGAARLVKKQKVLVVELHHRENERRADPKQ
jgi:hypothetical protein